MLLVSNNCKIGVGYSCAQCILHRSEAELVSRAAAADQSAEKATGETRQADISAPSSVSPVDTVL